MKVVVTFIITLISITLYSQDKWFSNSGKIAFVSETEVIDIAGENNSVVTFFKPSTGEIVFALRMTEFSFELPLAWEHFNENYVESDKYPTSSFKGTVTNNSEVNYKVPGTYPVIVSGELTIHGVTRQITEKGLITIKEDSGIGASSAFVLRPEDFKIKVPRIVRDKVAEEVSVTVIIDYKPYKDGK